MRHQEIRALWLAVRAHVARTTDRGKCQLLILDHVAANLRICTVGEDRHSWDSLRSVPQGLMAPLSMCIKLVPY